jgi:succinyl-CoA synthetase beta subunit
VVVRLEGNNADVGAKTLEDSEFNLIAAQGFADAAERVVNEAKQTGASV